jgi:hypothetical protein
VHSGSAVDHFADGPDWAGTGFVFFPLAGTEADGTALTGCAAGPGGAFPSEDEGDFAAGVAGTATDFVGTPTGLLAAGPAAFPIAVPLAGLALAGRLELAGAAATALLDLAEPGSR